MLVEVLMIFHTLPSIKFMLYAEVMLNRCLIVMVQISTVRFEDLLRVWYQPPLEVILIVDAGFAADLKMQFKLMKTGLD